MEPVNLTANFLEEIRDGQRNMLARRQRFEERMVAGQHSLEERMVAMQEQSNQRFLAIETTLRDMVEQMVLLTRGIETGRLDDHEEWLKARAAH